MTVTYNTLLPRTRYAFTLTSGTSWTVPAGVTYVNVTLMGGGGGGGGVCGGTSTTGVTGGGVGGTTSFTGATSAVGGNGMSANNLAVANGSFFSNGVVPTANSGKGGATPFGTQISSTTPITQNGNGSIGSDGQVITSTLATTPGNSITYAIGAGGTAGTNGGGTSGSVVVQAGASGRIDLEYWV